MFNGMTKFEECYEALVTAQYDRDYLPWNDGLYWNDYEKLVMYKTVNQIRKRAGYSPVLYSEISAVERQASGHIDYTKKFALYCSELASKEV